MKSLDTPFKFLSFDWLSWGDGPTVGREIWARSVLEIRRTRTAYRYCTVRTDIPLKTLLKRTQNIKEDNKMERIENKGVEWNR